LEARLIQKAILGVIANSEKVGNVLYDNYEYVLNMLANNEFEDELKQHGGENFAMQEVIEFMSSDPEGCNGCYSSTLESVVELQGDTFTVLKPYKINKWDLNRVEDYITKEHDFFDSSLKSFLFLLEVKTRKWQIKSLLLLRWLDLISTQLHLSLQL
jgi:hypothetical protein